MDANSLSKSFPAGIELPSAFRALCDWVAKNGYPISGYFELREHDDETIRCWFGCDAAVGDLAQFGAGADGSLYCLWRCPDGRTPIVHMGSEGDNNFVLAATPVDFLRLLAVGYDEIGFADFDAPPPVGTGESSVNRSLQQWVEDSFGVTVPQTGSEITRDAQASHDDFQAWINSRCR
jgi:hypothetical protein